MKDKKKFSAQSLCFNGEVGYRKGTHNLILVTDKYSEEDKADWEIKD